MIKHGHEKRMFGKIKIYAECKTNKGFAAVGAYHVIKCMQSSEYRQRARLTTEIEIKRFMSDNNAFDTNTAQGTKLNEIAR